MRSGDFRGFIKFVAEDLGLDLLLVEAIVTVESGGDQYAARYEPHYRWFADPDKHARALRITLETEKVFQQTSWGLMQVMGGTARWLGFRGQLPELTNVNVGLKWGCLYLSRLFNKYEGDAESAVAAYNAGSVRKDAAGKLVNQAYVRKVMDAYGDLQATHTAASRRS